MIRQKFYIDSYDWSVYCYFAVDTYYVDEILAMLSRIDCPSEFMRQAEENMASGQLNNGITYSNTKTGESVMVVALTTSRAQFLNSFSHELHHLTEHISHARGVDCQSEESAYLCGDLAQTMYDYIKPLL